MEKYVSLTEFEQHFMHFQTTVTSEWTRRLNPILSTSQARILRILKEEGRQKITELADRMVITPGAVTSLSVKLISHGYAIRSKDERDRRIVYLEITNEGLDLLKQYSQEVKNTINVFFKDLTEEDLLVLTNILNKMLNNVKEGNEEGKVK